MSKFVWKFHKDDMQMWYSAEVGRDTLCVFANNWSPNLWLGQIKYHGNIVPIYDKTENDKSRKKQGLDKNCDIRELHTTTLLSSNDPEYMKRKVAHCYSYNKIEVCR